MNIDTLIKLIPENNNRENMSEWFYDVKQWAEKNNERNIKKDAENGLFFIGSESRIKEYKYKILGELKSLRKEVNYMNDSKKIFIVHGHNAELKETVARKIEKVGYEAIILHEQASGGDTIIEKLERMAANVQFAIVLYTGDDKCLNEKRRARQNVVFEHGYLIAKLGRNRVCAIVEDNVEIPSDLDGVVYIPKNGFEKELYRELKNAGLDVDANKML